MGQTLGRVPNGVDTNQSGNDFAVLPFPTPWTANDAETTCDGEFSIKINEFMPNPHTVLSDGTEISDDEGREWVELYNSSGNPIDLTGWKLQWGGNPSYSGGEVTLPAGTMIDGNGYLLVGGEYVENADVITPLSNDFDMTLASSNADGLRLLHCGPGVADTVIYGPSEDGIAVIQTSCWTTLKPLQHLQHPSHNRVSPLLVCSMGRTAIRVVQILWFQIRIHLVQPIQRLFVGKETSRSRSMRSFQIPTALILDKNGLSCSMLVKKVYVWTDGALKRHPVRGHLAARSQQKRF